MPTSQLYERLARFWPKNSGKPNPSAEDSPSIESRDAITRFLFVEDAPEAVDLCFVLGCPTPTNMDPAIALHKRGFTPLIMAAGHGPAPQAVPEAVQFREYAVKRGVPEDAIMVETSSTNTRENFTLSAPIIEKKIGWDRIRSVALVTKPFHTRRALMTARHHWPAHLRYIMQPTQEPTDFPAATWWQTDIGRAFVMRELVAIGTYAQQGDIGDF